MGTRVDFYVGRGENAEWLGSYPFDGYPSGVFDAELFTTSGPIGEQAWRGFVAEFLSGDNADIATTPEMGWPWPWRTSATTDYAHAWDDGAIYGSNFGRRWFEVDPDAVDWGQSDDADDDEKSAVFPDMTSRKAVIIGPRSGLIVISPRGPA
jgi:hypothetical protein